MSTFSVVVLVSILKRLCQRYEVRNDARFWKNLRRIFSWHWAKDSVPVETLLRDGIRPAGLPQGLVASGFFSNAYMVEFDAAVRAAIQQGAGSLPFAIVDYCRYVDDMRLVVKWKPSPQLAESEVKTHCTKWFTVLLDEHAEGQRCNPDKTDYTAHRDLLSTNSRTATMNLVQHQLSGPVDSEAMAEASVALDGLLRAVEVCPDARRRSTPENAPALARIFEASTEIRDDTLKRFATYRLFKVLRQRRQLVSQDKSKDGLLECKQIDSDIEIAARRMVHFWAEDPSLGIVLRHAMNLMPGLDLIEPVLKVLQQWIEVTPRSKADTVARWVCLYAAADLLKAGVIETGVNTPKEALPAGSDLDEYRERLADFAEWVLNSAGALGTPWYLKQQAVMFLASVGRHVPIRRQWREPALSDYVCLARAVRGQLDKIRSPEERLAPLMIVVDQFRNDSRRTVSRLANWLATCTPGVAARVAEQVYLANHDLFEHLLSYTEDKAQHTGWRGRLDRCYTHAVRPKAPSGETLPARKRPLADIAAAPDNPFRQENAAVQLLVAVIDVIEKRGQSVADDRLSPKAVLVKCSDWDRLRNPCLTTQELGLQVTFATKGCDDPRYRFPTWCPPERRRFMLLGRLLRAAMTGNSDYTAPVSLWPRLRGVYRGIGSCWFKRQHGMYHRPDALGGPQASCSPWISELLAKLLLWPGCRETHRLIRQWHDVVTLADLKVLALARLKEQACVYARACELPVYVHPVGLRLKCPPKLTTVLIQTVRPRLKDVKLHGPLLDAAEFVPVRRDHLASLLRIAEKLLAVRSTYEKECGADLILLPEISVHENDVDLIERLVDRTHAMVFCGLIFRHIPGVDGLVNTARWIIPDKQETGRSLIHIDQGKQHMTDDEKTLGIQPWRPHQVVIELANGKGTRPYRISGSVCFDATDLRLAADLRDVTDMFVVPACNKDVGTFDAMAGTLSYHMFQHMVIVNAGEYGGTTVMAPYKERHERVLTHHHGGDHAAISIVDIVLSDYQEVEGGATWPLKTPPAGYRRHKTRMQESRS